MVEIIEITEEFIEKSKLSLQQAIKLTKERTLKRARGMVEMIIASNGEFVVWKIKKMNTVDPRSLRGTGMQCSSI